MLMGLDDTTYILSPMNKWKLTSIQRTVESRRHLTGHTGANEDRHVGMGWQEKMNILHCCIRTCYSKYEFLLLQIFGLIVQP